jgi:LacI family gluconate utilization system Gnt-I transcriptional repressor
LPSINDTIFGDVISGVNEVLRPKGYITFIGESNFDGPAEEEILRMVLSLHPAGIIITGGINRTKRAQEMLQNWNCPTIQIWDDEESGFDGSVAPSHSEAGQLIAQHFLTQGFRAPAYLGAELTKDVCAGRRFEAFRQTLRANGLFPTEMVREDLPRQNETGRTLVQALMDSAPQTDAIYCLNDAIALGALSWLHEKGYEVPSQIAVAGFNGTSVVNAVRTRLTTVHVERYNLGKIAAEAVLGLLGHKPVDRLVRLEPELIVGNTT